MRRVFAWGFFAYLAFLGLLLFPVTNSSFDEKELKYEPVEKQIKPYKEISTQEIMDKLVRKSKEERIKGFEITYDEAQMLMRIAMAEAGADGKDGMAMVMAVVLNRVNDDRFPDSIEKVIFQDGQFSPISDGRYYKAEPDVECHLALVEIEMGNYDNVDALYFASRMHPRVGNHVIVFILELLGIIDFIKIKGITMGCKHNLKSCLNCEREKCILDEEPAKEKPNRKEYQHRYYLKRKKLKRYKCNFCGKEIHGEAYRLGKNMYCNFNCIMCQLWDENEKRIKIISV